MKKYLIILSVFAFVACNKSNTDTANSENEVRQRTIDSMDAVNNAPKHHEVHSSESHHSTTTNASSSSTNNDAANDTKTSEPAKRKGMSNTTKGALIGTGVGVVGGALTGAAASEDKGKGAVIGGVVGGAAGSAVGYGVGAKKDKDLKDANK